MKIILVLALLLTVNATAAEVGNYQLVSGNVLFAAKNGTGESMPCVFRLDTRTGQVWQLVAVADKGTNVATTWFDVTPPASAVSRPR